MWSRLNMIRRILKQFGRLISYTMRRSRRPWTSKLSRTRPLVSDLLTRGFLQDALTSGRQKAIDSLYKKSWISAYAFNDLCEIQRPDLSCKMACSTPTGSGAKTGSSSVLRTSTPCSHTTHSIRRSRTIWASSPHNTRPILSTKTRARRGEKVVILVSSGSTTVKTVRSRSLRMRRCSESYKHKNLTSSSSLTS